jgi:hypothetical protein
MMITAKTEFFRSLFSRAASRLAIEGFTGCGKTEFFEGDGLQAVRK